MAFLQEPGSISRLCRQLPDNAAFDGLIVEINGAELVKNLNIAKEIRHRLCGGPAEAVDLPPYPRTSPPAMEHAPSPRGSRLGRISSPHVRWVSIWCRAFCSPSL
jgi:hypothetical protein